MPRQEAQPWMKFNPGNWLEDAALADCSMEAQALWIAMLCYMAVHTDHYGCLIKNGITPPVKYFAQRFNRKGPVIQRLCNELQTKFVLSRSGEQTLDPKIVACLPPNLPNGIIFSRRMVKDKWREGVNRLNGSGGGNPQLLKRDNQSTDDPDNAQASLSDNQGDKARLRTKSQKEEDSSPSTNRDSTPGTRPNNILAKPESAFVLHPIEDSWVERNWPDIEALQNLIWKLSGLDDLAVAAKRVSTRSHDGWPICSEMLARASLPEIERIVREAWDATAAKPRDAFSWLRAVVGNALDQRESTRRKAAAPSLSSDEIKLRVRFETFLRAAIWRPEDPPPIDGAKGWPAVLADLRASNAEVAMANFRTWLGVIETATAKQYLHRHGLLDEFKAFVRGKGLAPGSISCHPPGP